MCIQIVRHLQSTKLGLEVAGRFFGSLVALPGCWLAGEPVGMDVCVYE